MFYHGIYINRFWITFINIYFLISYFFPFILQSQFSIKPINCIYTSYQETTTIIYLPSLAIRDSV